MKLENIMDREGIKFKKMLIPTNSGYDNLEINPYTSLEIQNPELYFSIAGKPITSLPMWKRIEDAKGDNRLGIEYRWYRGEDIPKMCDYYTKKGIPVAGKVGDDLLDEYMLRNPKSMLRVLDTIDWVRKQTIDDSTDNGMPLGYTRPTLCLISEKDPYGLPKRFKDIKEGSTLVINKKYKQTAMQFIKQYGLKFKEIRILSGQVENEIPENSDYCIDIVLTGKTLQYSDKKRTIPRQSNLGVVKIIRQSDISMITSWPMAYSENEVIRSADESVLYKQFQTIENRLKNPNDSLTSKLLQDENKLIKKIAEETAEMSRAYIKGDVENLKQESQQVLWLVQTALANKEIKWDQFLDYVKTQQ
jgi:phosphoribosyl-ATP pyrophosphohydrolase